MVAASGFVSRIPPRLRGVVVVYTVLGLVLWAVPLLNILHVESAAVVAGAAFFVAGTSALRWLAEGGRVGVVLRGQLAALGVPWALLTMTLLWTPNCGYMQGLLFFALFPVVSVVLAVGLARALVGLRHARAAFWGLGLAVLLLTPLYDLGLHPQFYVYNHVFGGVLGPIYDEELALRPGLFFFRGLTLCWAGVLYAVGSWRRDGAVRALVPGVVCAVFLAAGYRYAAPLGINTPEGYLAGALGGVYHTAHFDLYYDPATLDADAVARLGEDHEYRYAQLARRLEVTVPGRIASYLYPDPGTKARLTGAHRTNVAPVWLRRPQVHVLMEAYEQVFPHELAHVFSRAFGLPVLRASLSVGLVEGLAVALEPPDGLPSPHDQVAAVLKEPPGAPAAALAERLSPLGFWTGRSAVSYTTMGSFVRYLLDAYGAERLKRVYARANFAAVYGKPASVLAAEWEAFLRGLPVVTRAAAPLARRRFAVPSLFEKRCPHYVPPYRRAYAAGLEALTAGDTTRALARLEEALARRPSYPEALDVWSRIYLARGAAAVVARLDTLADVARWPLLALHLGDAYTLLGQPGKARAVYEAARRRLPLYARDFDAWLVIRKSLADHPDVVRILTSGGDAAAQAEALTARDVPAAGFVAALRGAAAGRYERAVALLRTTPPLPLSPWNAAAQRAAVERQRWVWLARFSYLSGAPAAAHTYAERAVRAYREAGDFDAAAQMIDFMTMMQWMIAPA